MTKYFGAFILVAVIALAGCTYSDSPEVQAQTKSPGPVVTMAAPTSPLNNGMSTVEGDFQSQAASTKGSATLRVTGSGAVLELKDFATENSTDLRLYLSPGTLSPGENGELGLTSTVMHELGGLKSFQGNQQYEISSQQWADTPAIGSVIVYDYPTRSAYGTATLR